MIRVPLLGGAEMRVYPADPPTFDLSQVTPYVIAHGLARTNRFSGQTVKPFSDAEHSVRLAEWLHRLGHPRSVCRFALLHDAPECLGWGDPQRDIKRAFAASLREAEQHLIRALWESLGSRVPYGVVEPIVKKYDGLIGNYEAFQFGFPTEVLTPLLSPEHLPSPVQYWCPEIATQRWLRAWQETGGRA